MVFQTAQKARKSGAADEFRKDGAGWTDDDFGDEPSTQLMGSGHLDSPMEQLAARERAEMGKKKGLPKEMTTDKNFTKWCEGISWSKDTDAELMEMADMFKKCGGKKGFCPRAKFLKNFSEKVTINGEPVEVVDTERLFNSSAIDYDYNNVSIHEFVTLMIVIRGKDSDKKLKFAFDMHDTDGSGKLEKAEVEKMLVSLVTDMKDEKKKTEMVGKMMKEMMEKRDLNKDGKIDYPELLKAVQDESMLREHLGRGATTQLIVDSMFAGKAKSSVCLVM